MLFSSEQECISSPTSHFMEAQHLLLGPGLQSFLCLEQTKHLKELGSSLVVQWLRIYLPMQGMKVDSWMGS